MKKFLLYSFTLMAAINYAQTVADFEVDAENPVQGTVFGMDAILVDNPNQTGINTSERVLRVNRNDDRDRWFALAQIDLDDVQIAPGEQLFLSV